MMKPRIYDNHGRPINYLRVAVTDRCNLRCFYCMPAEGITYLPRNELLSFEEIVRTVRLFSDMGINKVRITGGEPFVRRDLIALLENLASINDLEVHLTTNGVLTLPFVPRLKKLGLASVNLSLDTLDAARFRTITRRDTFREVWSSYEALRDHAIPVKMNCVVMEGKNTEDIIPMAELTREEDVSVRFIEEMPFNGEGSHYPKLNWTYRRILGHLQRHFPGLAEIENPQNATATHYRIPGYLGNIGIIAAFSRTFCGTCNRIRITAQGILKTCLYDHGVMDIKAMLRAGISDEALRHELLLKLGDRPANGFEAERNRGEVPVSESMSTIGG